MERKPSSYRMRFFEVSLSIARCCQTALESLGKFFESVSSPDFGKFDLEFVSNSSFLSKRLFPTKIWFLGKKPEDSLNFFNLRRHKKFVVKCVITVVFLSNFLDQKFGF